MEPLRRIGRAAQEVPCQPSLLRTYDALKLVVPLRDADGERLYTTEMIERARQIKAERAKRFGRGRSQA